MESVVSPTILDSVCRNIFQFRWSSLEVLQDTLGVTCNISKVPQGVEWVIGRSKHCEFHVTLVTPPPGDLQIRAWRVEEKVSRLTKMGQKRKEIRKDRFPQSIWGGGGYFFGASNERRKG